MYKKVVVINADFLDSWTDLKWSIDDKLTSYMVI